MTACIARVIAVLLFVSGCASWLPDSATLEKREALYSKFYDAMLTNAPRTEGLAEQLELCGRQLYVKEHGFLGALQMQEKHDKDVSLNEIVALFFEDACLPPDGSIMPQETHGSG